MEKLGYLLYHLGHTAWDRKDASDFPSVDFLNKNCSNQKLTLQKKDQVFEQIYF